MPGLNEMDVKRYVADHPAELLTQPVVIVSTEVAVGNGGFADLVAIDGDGNTLVIEAKVGSVSESAITQAIGYASAASSWATADLAGMFRRYYPPTGKPGSDLHQAFRNVFGKDYGGPSNNVRIILLGKSFHARCASTAEFLSKVGLSIELVTYRQLDAAESFAFSRVVRGGKGVGFAQKRNLTAEFGSKRRAARLDAETQSVFDQLTAMVRSGLPRGAFFEPLELPDADVYVYCFWGGQVRNKFNVVVKRMKNGMLSVRSGGGVKKNAVRDCMLDLMYANQTDIEREFGNRVSLQNTMTPIEDLDRVLIPGTEIERAAERVLLWRRVLHPLVVEAAKRAGYSVIT